MNATIALESMPPERNTPSGTSLIICDATAFRIAARIASTASSSVHVRMGTDAASQ